MNEFTKKLISTTTIFGVVLSVLIVSIVQYLVPSFNMYWLIGTCTYFMILEIAIILYVIHVSGKAKRDKKLVNAYLLTKVVKILISLIIIAIYLLKVQIEVKTYLIVFICLYLSYLIMESVLFVKIEKRLKEEIYEE